jgi:hypothetical protein
MPSSIHIGIAIIIAFGLTMDLIPYLYSGEGIAVKGSINPATVVLCTSKDTYI